MPEPVFVIRNQHGLYLTRQNEWVDGHDAAPLFKAAFRDIALNTLIELNAKDIELRGVIVEAEVNEKGLPRVTTGDLADTATADAATDSGDDVVEITEAGITGDDDASDASATDDADDETALTISDDSAPAEQSDT